MIRDSFDSNMLQFFDRYIDWLASTEGFSLACPNRMQKQLGKVLRTANFSISRVRSAVLASIEQIVEQQQTNSSYVEQLNCSIASCLRLVVDRSHPLFVWY